MNALYNEIQKVKMPDYSPRCIKLLPEPLPGLTLNIAELL